MKLPRVSAAVQRSGSEIFRAGIATQAGVTPQACNCLDANPTPGVVDCRLFCWTGKTWFNTGQACTGCSDV